MWTSIRRSPDRRSTDTLTPKSLGPGTFAANCVSAPVNECPAINTKLSPLARQILHYLRDHPRAEDTIEGIMVWWVSERAIKLWLPEARKSLAALVSRGYLAKNTGADGQIFYRATKLVRARRARSRK
jgi:hypothetical protein